MLPDSRYLINPCRQGVVKSVVDCTVNYVVLHFEDRSKSVKVELEADRWTWKRVFASGKVAKPLAKPASGLAGAKPGRLAAAPNAKSARPPTTTTPAGVGASSNSSRAAPRRKRARKKAPQPGSAPARPAAPALAARKKESSATRKHAQPPSSTGSVSQPSCGTSPHADDDRGGGGGQAGAFTELAVSQYEQQPVLKAVPSSSIEYTELVRQLRHLFFGGGS